MPTKPQEESISSMQLTKPEHTGASQLIRGVRPTMGRTMRGVSSVAAAIAVLLLGQGPVLAKVAPATLADLVRRSDFIGVVRVEKVSGRIPLIRQRRASATILHSWKGPRTGVVKFVAQATWTCDISDAKVGEETVVFIQGDHLALAGRGRMPIFSREGRQYVAIWSDVFLPASLATVKGPEPDYDFIRGVLVDDLVAELSRSLPEVGQVE